MLSLMGSASESRKRAISSRDARPARAGELDDPLPGRGPHRLRFSILVGTAANQRPQPGGEAACQHKWAPRDRNGPGHRPTAPHEAVVRQAIESDQHMGAGHIRTTDEASTARGPFLACGELDLRRRREPARKPLRCRDPDDRSERVGHARRWAARARPGGIRAATPVTPAPWVTMSWGPDLRPNSSTSIGGKAE